MADWSLWSNSSKNLKQDSLCIGKSVMLFHSANWAMDWQKNYLKTEDMYCQTLLTLAQWQVKQYALWES